MGEKTTIRFRISAPPDDHIRSLIGKPVLSEDGEKIGTVIAASTTYSDKFVDVEAELDLDAEQAAVIFGGRLQSVTVGYDAKR